MTLELKNPLAIFDLETTGINISKDRIVEIAIVKLLPNGSREEYHQRINPAIPIPKEVSLIHGIYDEDIQDAPSFKQVAKTLTEFLKGCDLGGFNAIKFDIPMLVEEFLRANVDFDVNKRSLVDVQKIFHLMEKRNLSAAFKFYCEKDLENAHSAKADTDATVEILIEQVKRYSGQTAVDNLGHPVGKIQNTVASLHKLSSSHMVDFAGRIVYNKEGKESFNFGKHKGKSVAEVLKKEPSYYDWMMNGDFPLDTKRKLTEIKLRNFQL